MRSHALRVKRRSSRSRSRQIRGIVSWDLHAPRSGEQTCWPRVKSEMERTLKEILASYDDTALLSEAHTIPAAWYTDARVAALELENVFSRSWQAVGRTDQGEKPSQYLTAGIAHEPRRRPRGPGTNPGPVPSRRDRERANRRRPRRRQQAARFFQCLPPPCDDCDERTLRRSPAPPLPVSRVDLQPRRRTPRHHRI